MSRFSANRGFTLIELLIAVAILGILSAIAYSSYSSSAQKSRRSDAKDALTYAATLQERWYLQRSQYTSVVTDIGGATSNDGYYAITVVNNSPCATAGECFTITATAQGVQASDTDCTTFTIDHLGRKRAFDSTSAANDNCW